MNHTTRWLGAVLVAAGLLVQGCSETQQPPPPLFNAKDLSLQCPTGQVGWDFSTGGNDSAIVENSVSREITVDSAMLGSCNYKDDFAASCDGKSDCTRLGQQSTSPACSGGTLDLTYHCGDEPHRYRVVVDEASSKSINLACREPIVIYSAVYGSNAPSATNQANITTAVAAACTGKRRCSLEDAYVLNNRQDPWPNAHKETTVRYYCGNDTKLYETVVASGQRIDVQCPSAAAKPPEFSDTLRVMNVECAAWDNTTTALCTHLSDERQQSIATYNARIRALCDGKKSCKIPVDATGPTATVPMFINYWCTSPQAPERKLFYNSHSYQKTVELSCGAPITIVSAEGNGASLEEARKACNHKSRCIFPDLINNGKSGGYSAQYKYACGDNLFDVRSTPTLGSGTVRSGTGTPATYRILAPTAPIDRQIECPPADNKALRGGIRIVSATFDGQDGIVKATNLCFGRGECNIFASWAFGGGNDTVVYRCGSSYATKTVRGYSSILPAKMTLTCRPDVAITALTCDRIAGEPVLTETRCIGRSGRQYEIDLATAQSWCQPGNNGECTFTKFKGQTIRARWRCGQDPKEYEYVGDGEPAPWDPERTVRFAARCDIPENPYVEKACVAESCPGNTRRDAKLACIPDSTKTPAIFASAPILREWLPGENGKSSQWGGADVTTLKEDVPYQVFSYSQYTTPTRGQLPPTTSTTVWAYDEFAAKDGAGVPANKAKTFGFRCVMGEAPIRDAEYRPVTAGYRLIINGGKGGVLPPECFREDVEDGKSAWADGARRVGIPESQFRRNYSRTTSWVVSAFDATGKFTARVVNKTYVRAPNPIGFFYDSNNGWIDQLSFYGQRADWAYAKRVTFEPSKTIELNAMAATLRNASIKVDVAKRDLLPAFDVDFTWSQRGDSPAKNPLSPRTLLSSSSATPLNRRNLRVSIEMARVDTTLSNEWIPVNATQFPTSGLGAGNALSQTVRLSAQITSALRERLLSVKGNETLQTSDGWMRGWDDDRTAFKVRVCMDFDGNSHTLGDTSLDDRYVSATRDGVEYRLGFKRRCVESAPLLAERELFVYPTSPLSETERALNTAASPRQGDGAAGSSNDTGNQSSCMETSGNQRCNGASRNNMNASGQFSISLVESETNDTASQEETTKTTSLSSNMKLFGFKVFDLSGGGGAEPQSSGAWEVTINLTPNLDAIASAVKGRRQAGVKSDAKPIKTKPKKKKGVLSKVERDGLAAVLSKEFPFTLGPFPFVLEVGFSVGFGFGVGITIGGDSQSVSRQVNPKYPCLKASGPGCFIAYDSLKSYEEALDDCNVKGGRLAEARTSADLTAVKAAMASVGAATSQFWLGGQLAYQYGDPRCDISRAPSCAGISRTRYAWLTGNVPFANQVRQETALVDPGSLTGNHGFGSSLGNLVSRVPNRAAVLLRKDTGLLETATIDTTARYVCTFDPANSYIETRMGIELGAEFSAGFSAKLCTPSTDIGFCLAAELKLITAGIKIKAERSRIFVFDNTRRKVSLLGDSTVEGSWEVAFLSGAFSAEMNFLFWSTSWEIASYGGIYTIEGELFPALSSPYRRSF